MATTTAGTGRVLVGFAGGEPSLDALALGGALASATGAGVLALHIDEAEAPYSQYDPLHQGNRRADAAELRERLERVAPELAPGVRVSFETFAAQNPAAGLHEFAASERVSMIVTGATHLNPVAAVLLGATGERLLDASPCPVAIASRGLHERAPLRLRRIGCGLDGTAEGAAGLASASLLARAAGSELEGVTVIRRGVPWRRRSHVQQATAWVEKALAGAGVPEAKATVCCGRPAAELTAFGDGLDLLVLGSCGHAPLDHVVTGSVSGALVRAAEVPLMVVPRGAAAAPA